MSPALLPEALARLRERRPSLQLIVRTAANAVLLDEPTIEKAAVALLDAG